MIKTIVTLFRGAKHDAEENFKDTNAHQLLAQHMRDATQEIAIARKAVAVAIAQNKQEQAQHQKLLDRLSDIESRAMEAIEQGKSDLAQEAALTIANLEAERDASEEAQSQFDKEIGRLKANVQTAEIKLRELQRGQRLALATHKTQDLRTKTMGDKSSSLNEAEDTLNRLQKRQKELQLTDQVLAEMDASGNPDAMTKKLADAGCGKSQKSSADEVLERLKAKSAKTKKSTKSVA